MTQDQNTIERARIILDIIVIFDLILITIIAIISLFVMIKLKNSNDYLVTIIQKHTINSSIITTNNH